MLGENYLSLRQLYIGHKKVDLIGKRGEGGMLFEAK